jgi:flagellar biosynthesis GTPase FlhF
MSATTEQKKVRVWRADGKIDRSKRAGKVPAEVTKENILPATKTRNRPDYDYSETLLSYKHLPTDDLGITKFKQLSIHGKSKNVLEKRSKALAEKKNESTKKTTVKKEKKPAEEKKAEAKKEEKKVAEPVEEEEEEEVEEEEEEKVETPKKAVEEKKSTTPIRKRKSSTSSKTVAPKPLSEAVYKQIERLGGKIPDQPVARRVYRDHKEFLPTNIQAFLDVNWEGKKFSHSKIDGVEFTEFTLAADEWNAFDFLAKNDQTAVLIGDGDMIIAALTSDTSDDFTVYLINEENTKPITMKLSKLLSGMKEAEIEEEEEEEADE